MNDGKIYDSLAYKNIDYGLLLCCVSGGLGVLGIWMFRDGQLWWGVASIVVALIVFVSASFLAKYKLFPEEDENGKHLSDE